MNYTHYERALSKPRINRFLFAVNGDIAAAIKLYQLNIQLSQNLFGLIGIFEVTLRNHIDHYYKTKMDDKEWLRNQFSEKGKFSKLSHKMHKYESYFHVQNTIKKLAHYYHHDKLVSALNFGFWIYMFAPIQFREGGQDLHKIFIRRKVGTNRKMIFEDLNQVRKLRNRIAHHEPLCFNNNNQISTLSTMKNYQIIIKYIQWLGYLPGKLFPELDEVPGINEEIIALDYNS